jgi:hypothetical protein
MNDDVIWLFVEAGDNLAPKQKPIADFIVRFAREPKYPQIRTLNGAPPRAAPRSAAGVGPWTRRSVFGSRFPVDLSRKLRDDRTCSDPFSDEFKCDAKVDLSISKPF